MPAHVEVLNSGPYPINGAVLELASDEYPMEIVYGTILPGEHVKDTHMVRRWEMVFGEATGEPLWYSRIPTAITGRVHLTVWSGPSSQQASAEPASSSPMSHIPYGHVSRSVA